MLIKIIIITGEQREERPDLDGRHRIIGQHDEYISIFINI